MNNTPKKIFIMIFFILLLLPLTYYIGIKDYTVVHGSESITEAPNIQEKSFFRKEFQPLFESYWNSHFGFRKLMLKIKNQIYDWVNLGKIHSGYNNVVIQGEQGYLYEKNYFDSYSKNCKDLPNSISKIKMLSEILSKKGVELFVVLAPNKAVTYPDFIPKRYKYFFGNDCQYYDKIEKSLKKMGIKVLNSQPIISKMRKEEKYEPFSKTGTHWNHYGAGRIVQEVSSHFGWGKVEISDIENRNTPYTTERDIANLLNLLIGYKTDEKFYRPIYKKEKPVLGTTTVIGNSFSYEFVFNLKEAGLSEKIYHFENKPLKPDDVDNIMQSSNIIFVYTDSPLVDYKSQFYKKIDFLLNYLNILHYTFNNPSIPKNLKLYGLSHIEKWGRWSENEKVEFKISNLPQKKLFLRFNMTAFLNEKRTFQNATIFVNGKKVSEWHYEFRKAPPKTELEISSTMIKDGTINVTIAIDNPVSPKELGLSNDNRKLALGFNELIVQEK